MQLKNLAIRSVSGIVLAAILLGSVWLSDISRYVVLGLIGLSCQWEFLRHVREEGVKVLIWFSLLVSVVIYTLYSCNSGFQSTEWLVYAAVLVPVIRFSMQLYRKQERPMRPVAYELFSFVYAILPVMLLSSMDKSLIVILFLLVWTNDVGAYLVGVTCGKHRLFERLSPKKSWEGFWGGLIFSVVLAFLAGNYFMEENPWLWGILGLVTVIAGVFGDLFESMFKRSIGIKDSGRIIPGHGGFLDRFDALLFAAPCFWVFYAVLF